MVSTRACLYQDDVKLMDQTYKAFPSSLPGQSGEHGDPELVQQRSRGSAGLHFRNAKTEVKMFLLLIGSSGPQAARLIVEFVGWRSVKVHH